LLKFQIQLILTVLGLCIYCLLLYSSYFLKFFFPKFMANCVKSFFSKLSIAPTPQLSDKPLQYLTCSTSAPNPTEPFTKDELNFLKSRNLIVDLQNCVEKELLDHYMWRSAINSVMLCSRNMSLIVRPPMKQKFCVYLGEKDLIQT
jgi:hypothetical protein